MRVVAASTALLLLAACGQRAAEPGGVTSDEARQLNDAAAMLDANAVGANVLIANEQDDE